MKKDSKEKRLPYIDSDLYDLIKIHCIANRIEFKKFAEDALKEKLARDKFPDGNIEDKNRCF